MNDKNDDINTALRLVHEVNFGILNSSFLTQSVSVLNLAEPLRVTEDETIDSVMHKLKEHKSGCAVVLSPEGKVVGIFSERDYVLKIYGSSLDPLITPISKQMTSNPITQPPEASMTHVLNLMSNGGFRHIPIVDAHDMLLWVVSVKDIVDHMVSDMSESLLDFEAHSG